jgi:hypothetical protein
MYEFKHTFKHNSTGAAIGGFAFLTIIVLFFVGWCLNIYKLVTFDGTLGEMAALEIVRVIGIFIAPIGAVTDYF